MHAILGAPYERIIRKFIRKGYASSKTEVIRQALFVYNEAEEEGEIGPRKMGAEERRLVGKAVEHEMKKIREGKVKTYSLEEIKKKYNIK